MCKKLSSCGSDASAACAPVRGSSAKQYSARQPNCCTLQFNPYLRYDFFTPSAHLEAKTIDLSNCGCNKLFVSVARTAAIASALPDSVPPRPDTSTSWLLSCFSICSAISLLKPYAATGTPPPIVFPTTKISGFRFQSFVQPPGPAQIVCVSSIAKSVPYL